MNSDNYDTLLADIALVKEQLFKQSKVLDSIENDVKLLLMMYGGDVKKADAKDGLSVEVEKWPPDYELVKARC